MRLRPHRRILVVWNPSVGPADRYDPPRPARTIRRRIRTVALLTVIGLMWLPRAMRTRWLAYKRHCELGRELAGYSTPAQRSDLEAILDRYPDDVTYELRAILASQAMAADDNRFPAAGRAT